MKIFQEFCDSQSTSARCVFFVLFVLFTSSNPFARTVTFVLVERQSNLAGFPRLEDQPDTHTHAHKCNMHESCKHTLLRVAPVADCTNVYFFGPRFRRSVCCFASAALDCTAAVKKALRHAPGLCGQRFGLWPGSQMALSLALFSFSCYLVLIAHRANLPPPPFLLEIPPSPLLHSSPQADQDIFSCKQ